MDGDKLKKLAESIREYAKALEENKQSKLASITLASTAIELLRRKING